MLGLLAAVLFGAADFVARNVSRRIGAYRALFVSQCVGLVGLSLFLGATHGWPAHAPRAAWGWAAVAGALEIAAALALYRAFSVGTLALVAPIAASFGAVAALLSLLGGERLSGPAWLGVALTAAGIALASVPASPGAVPAGAAPAGETGATRGLGWALLAAGGFGAAFWLLGTRANPALGGTVPVWVVRVLGVVLLAGLAAPLGRSLRLPAGALGGGILLGLLDTGAMVCVGLGLNIGPISVVAVLTSLASPVTILLALVFLRDRLARHQWVGVGVILAGVVLINL